MSYLGHNRLGRKRNNKIDRLSKIKHGEVHLAICYVVHN